MGQHAQAIREKHTARNVTLIVLAVLIVLLAIAAVFGMQLYKQAKSVKAHESQAISSLSAINDPAKLKDAAALQASIAQAQQQTAQAKQIAHGSLSCTADTAIVAHCGATACRGQSFRCGRAT